MRMLINFHKKTLKKLMFYYSYVSMAVLRIPKIIVKFLTIYITQEISRFTINTINYGKLRKAIFLEYL